MLKQFEDKMQKSLDSMANDFMTIRAGRANPHVLVFHSSPGTAVVAVIIGCTVFDVCTVEFCWVYFLFEARVFANVIQAGMTVLR